MKVLGPLLQLLAAAVLAGAVAAGIGLLSAHVYVVALGPLLAGLAAGAGAGLVALLVTGRPERATRVAAVLAVLGGWVTLQALDDLHFRAAWQSDLVAARFVSTGADETMTLADEDEATFAAGAGPALEAEVARQIGFAGPVGRWLFRADQGIRLLGPWHDSRGLAVGRWGAIVWALVEILLAALVALAVVRRLGRALDAGSAGVAEDLDHERGEEQ